MFLNIGLSIIFMVKTMKVRKKTSILALMLVLTMTYFISLMSAYNAYTQFVEAERLKYPVELSPYVDFSPFIATSQGLAFVFLGGVLLAFGFLATFYQKL
jgi:hypothetical protein